MPPRPPTTRVRCWPQLPATREYGVGQQTVKHRVEGVWRARYTHSQCAYTFTPNSCSCSGQQASTSAPSTATTSSNQRQPTATSSSTPPNATRRARAQAVALVLGCLDRPANCFLMLQQEPLAGRERCDWKSVVACERTHGFVLRLEPVVAPVVEQYHGAAC